MRALNFELFVLKQMFQCSMRHLRLLKIATILFGLQFILGRNTKALRAGFTLVKIIDDILDGEQPRRWEPHTEIKDFHKRLLNQSWLEDSELDELAQYFIQTLQANPYKSEILRKTEELVTTMLADRWRVKHRQLWSAEQLDSQHFRKFECSLDLVLACIESPFRAKDMPDILKIFAWRSTIQDLREDLSKGLCNIPFEIISLGLTKDISTRLTQEKPVLQWIQSENERAHLLILKCEKALQQLPPLHGRFVFQILIRSMQAFHTRIARRTKDTRTRLQTQESI